eukprot:TRINITY_DN265_c3_g1_i1.p2 TRINITY_DN265_c3_g1~~TRINITY_DN265_c3_g1_i1.p2  ORF type:complete len:73 (-),score=5.78 TRINITY_DN265_c3_g1_i1:107-325(-)
MVRSKFMTNMMENTPLTCIQIRLLKFFSTMQEINAKPGVCVAFIYGASRPLAAPYDLIDSDACRNIKTRGRK